MAKKKLNRENVRREAWELISAHKRPLAAGMLLMAVSRIAGFVLPASSKYLIDTVIGEQRADLLGPLALAAGGATIVQAIASFGLAKIVSSAAPRANRDMRATVQSHVIRLPVSYFDSTKAGALITRIMNDPEGIRNLV
jgi:subfamily B ATP-binding cassette protein MsbA